MDARDATKNREGGKQDQDGGKQESQGGKQDRDLMKEFEVLKKDLAQVRKDLQNLAEAGVETASGTRDRLESEVRQLIDRMREVSNSATEGEGDMMGDVRRRVGDKPVTAVATALGIGFFVGWLASRK